MNDLLQWSIFYDAISVDKRWRPSTINVDTLLQAINAALNRGVSLAEIEDRVRAMKGKVAA